jgi:hypothetical protein
VEEFEVATGEHAERLRDPVKVEGSLEIRKPLGLTSDFLKSVPKS